MLASLASSVYPGGVQLLSWLKSKWVRSLYWLNGALFATALYCSMMKESTLNRILERFPRQMPAPSECFER